MKKLLQFLTLRTEFADNTSFRHLILVNGVLFLIVFLFGFFAFFNYFIFHRTDIALFNLAEVFITILTLLYYYKTKNITRIAKIATLNIMLFILLFLYTVNGEHFSPIWSIFLPIFAIFANGKKLGLAFSLIFYAILFSMAYYNIGIWDNGTWNSQDWIRLVTASTLLTLGVFLNESAYEEYERQLKIVRKHEKSLLQQLSKESITDELTQMYNRRYYNVTIKQLLATAKRNKQCVTFFILDIDFFKPYNDFYGHKKGDEALKKVASVLQEHVQREHDFVFRLGGEEFAGIVISEDIHKTHAWIEQLCKKIRALKIEHQQSQIDNYLTVSIGATSQCHPQNFDETTLYLKADEALYKAKSQGRNQCVFTSDS